MPRKGKNIYAQYSRDSFKAVDAVKNGMSYCKASEVYTVKLEMFVNN